MSDKTVPGYVIHSKCWYAAEVPLADGIGEQIMIAQYDADWDLGPGGEFAVRWYHISDRLVPRLEVFSDSWEMLLREMPELLPAMAELRKVADVTPVRFVDVLRRLGFVNMTPHERPNPPQS